MSFFDEMCDVLSLEFVDANYGIGKSIEMGWGRLFGGQVLGQVIAMAQHEVVEHRLNSIHCHFLQTGNVTDPVHYRRHVLREGRSYRFYRIEAYQQNQLIFHAVASLKTPEKGVNHQRTMPDVPKPDKLPSYRESLRKMIANLPEAQKARVAKRWIERVNQEPPVFIRPISPQIFLLPDSKKPERLMWFSASQDLSSDPVVHQQVLAWTSDIPILGTALQPSGIPPVSPQIKTTSLDHTIWFYDDFSVNDWLLMHCYSPVSGDGRGITFADIYREDGTLVACCSQEGMLRLRQH